MAARRTEYQIVGRYMAGREVTAYHLVSDNGKSGKYSREQVVFLAGRGQITNCSGQLGNDNVILRGVGISLEELPVQKEDGTMSKTGNVGHIRRGASSEDVMTQVLIIGTITQGRQTVGYTLRNSGGATKDIPRNEVFALAKQGKIGNARVQSSNGKYILRGVGCNLNELPSKMLPVPQGQNTTSRRLVRQHQKVEQVATKNVSQVPVKQATNNTNKNVRLYKYISIPVVRYTHDEFSLEAVDSDDYAGGIFDFGVMDANNNADKETMEKAFLSVANTVRKMYVLENGNNHFNAKINRHEVIYGYTSYNPGDNLRRLIEIAVDCKMKFIVADNVEFYTDNGPLYKGSGNDELYSEVKRLYRENISAIVNLVENSTMK